MHKKFPVLLAVALMAQTLPGRSQLPALHDGDRIAFYGDSITAQRLYTRFVEDFVLTRYPNLQVTFVNTGVPGDTVYGGYTGDQATRLKRDLYPQHPSVVTIMLGMNDGYYVPFEQKYFDIYKNGYRALLTAIQSNLPNARITLITPTPYDEVTHGTEFVHYNQVVSRHAEFVRELAAGSHLPVSDFHQLVTNLSNAGVQKNPSLAALLIPDRIHPAEASHWVMAAGLVRTWGFSEIVSRVILDGGQATVVEAENTRISEFGKTGSGLRWTQTDNALPLPLSLEDPMTQYVLGISGLSAMDQQILRVGGLTAPHYSLKIDGHAIASFTREELAAGINLALLATPMENQAKDVDGFAVKRAQLDQANFDLTIDDPKSASDLAVTQSIQAREAALLEAARKAAQPHPHTFELVPD